MRIGIDSHAAEQDGTGNCTYYRNLILELAKIDQKNDYVLFGTDLQHPFYRKLEGFKNFRVVEIARYPAWFRVYVALSLASYKAKVDVLHVQYFAPFFHAGKLVNTVHDLAAYHFPQFFSLFERMLFRWILPYSSRKAAQILTASEVSKNDLTTILRLPNGKVKVSFCGVNEVFTRVPDAGEVERIKNRYGIDGKFLLYVGRIDPRKNLVRLIRAYSEFRSRHTVPHKLLIAGKVYLEPEALQRTVKHSPFSKDIYFCGYVPDDDLPVLYRMADAFVYTSEYEGFGLPPLEAMAAETPVVASDIAIFREILADAALLVNPRDIDSLAEAMHRIVSDEALRRQLIQRGRGRVRVYDWANTARITLKTYTEALG